MNLKKISLVPVTNEMIEAAKTKKGGYKLAQVRFARTLTKTSKYNKKWKQALLNMGVISECDYKQFHDLKYGGESREQHNLIKHMKRIAIA